ncbi:oxygenase MpaB family protein [Aquabacterium lacunae]|uniref:oxygenase MpaB family protein n=1 Tax=Aquabacterium lacunae TaxID=2528630 RepID=UPI001A91900B|nr:oxygenase MpaB family protein [Aquabacterium lacunae]
MAPSVDAVVGGAPAGAALDPVYPVHPLPPSRHGQSPARSRQMVARLRWFAGRHAEPDAGQWAQMGQALWLGDPLADHLMVWMRQQGMGKAWKQFEALLATPQALPSDTPEPLARYLREARRWPAWVEPDRLARGAAVLHGTGLHGMMVLRDAGLMAGYQAAGLNKPLIHTGALAKGAQRRIAETTAWWLACTAPGGLADNGPGVQMTLRVRLMHALVRHQLAHDADWDANTWGLAINQHDMQATYLGFSVVQLIALKSTGTWLSRQDSEDVMHLWRAIGWLMGVDEALLVSSEQEGRVALYRNLLSQAPADDSSVALARALMDEPLQRRYADWPKLRGWLNKHRHLSLVQWFVGARGMRALGLPLTLPWYPVLTAAPKAASSVLAALSPVWRANRVVRGLAEQQAYLKVLMGDVPACPHQLGRVAGQADA